MDAGQRAAAGPPSRRGLAVPGRAGREGARRGSAGSCGFTGEAGSRGLGSPWPRVPPGATIPVVASRRPRVPPSAAVQAVAPSPPPADAPGRRPITTRPAGRRGPLRPHRPGAPPLPDRTIPSAPDSHRIDRRGWQARGLAPSRTAGSRTRTDPRTPGPPAAARRRLHPPSAPRSRPITAGRELAPAHGCARRLTLPQRNGTPRCRCLGRYLLRSPGGAGVSTGSKVSATAPGDGDAPGPGPADPVARRPSGGRHPRPGSTPVRLHDRPSFTPHRDRATPAVIDRRGRWNTHGP